MYAYIVLIMKWCVFVYTDLSLPLLFMTQSEDIAYACELPAKTIT